MRLWPAYIDAGKTRQEGRKVLRTMAIPNPKLEEILQACKELGLSPKREEKYFPHEQGKEERNPGCIIVEKKYPKLKTLKRVCDHIRKSRIG